MSLSFKTFKVTITMVFSFPDTYKQAYELIQRRRNIEPVNYNRQRLHENPIPTVPAQLSADAIDNTINDPENDDRRENVLISSDLLNGGANKVDEGAVCDDNNSSNASATGFDNNDRSQDENDSTLSDLFNEEANEEEDAVASDDNNNNNASATVSENSDHTQVENHANEEMYDNDDDRVPFNEVLAPEFVFPRDDGESSDEAHASKIDQKPDIMALQTVPIGNLNNIENILDDEEDVLEIIRDKDTNAVDVIMTFKPSKGLPKPFSATDHLLKQENDLMSGNLPFYKKVSYNVKTECIQF